MAIDVDTSGSPGWWFQRLARDLGKKQPDLEVLDRYYRGEPPLPKTIQNLAPEFKEFLRLGNLNYAKMLTESTRERQQLLAIRTSAADDDDGDKTFERIAAAAGLDVESAEVHRLVASLGSGYVIVGDLDDETNEPTITAEDPRQVITAHDPVIKRRVRAGLKVFHDPEEERDRAYVYNLGDPALGADARASVRVASRKGKVSLRRFDPKSWSWDEDAGGAEGQELPFNRIPVVRFLNEGGVGEYEPYLPHLDRINFWLFQAMVIALHQAHRQRGIKSDSLLQKLQELRRANDNSLITSTSPDASLDVAENALQDMYRSDPGAMWILPTDAEMWESGQTMLTEIGGMLDADVQRLAAVTRTPLFYLTADAANGSAEGASLSRESLVWKSRDRVARMKQGWRAVASLAFLWKRDTARADYAAIEAVMADPERHSLAERADAAVKFESAGVPWPTRMADALQFTPPEIDRMRGEREADMKAAAAAIAAQQAA